MSDVGWDENKFDATKFINTSVPDRWEGEDEDDDVKDNWDDEDPPEEKENEAPPPPPVVAPQPKKKNLKQVIAEKEEKRKKELEEKKKELVEEKRELTAEEKYAEKMRLQKIQEDADLELAKEAFGVTETPSTFDTMSPTTKEEFEELKKIITTKFQTLEKSPLYLPFLEDLVRDLCIDFDAEDVKKLSSTLNALANEKVKSQKSKAKKKAGKKAAIKVDKGNDYLEDYAAGDDFDDYF